MLKTAINAINEGLVYVGINSRSQFFFRVILSEILRYISIIDIVQKAGGFGLDTIALWIERVDELVWGPWLLFLLLGTGIYLNIRMEFLPLKNLKYALLCVVGMEDSLETKKGKQPDWEKKGRKQEKKGVSPFASLTTELAATIGTGNIVGVATAMVLGGPGALVWMMISALIGMATKLVESMCSVKYRRINEEGEYVGGPMYTLEAAFPIKKVGRILALAFSLFAVMASFGMGNMTQSNSIASAMKESFQIPTAKTGLVLTILTILVVLGGIRSIAKITQILVPIMGIFYIAGTLIVIARNVQNVPAGICQMVSMAISPQAIGGGLAGGIFVSAKEALRFGVSRGVFSNEAGLGAAGISAACAETSDYCKQGYISMTGVFLDTIVICSVTGLALIASGVLGTMGEDGELLTGTALVIAAFKTALGEWGAIFISICIALFAFATIAGWAYQGEKAFEYLTGTVKTRVYYRFAYALITFVGAICSLEVVWNFSDICNALMAVPNLIGVIALSSQACKEIKEYEKLGKLRDEK